jgi:hypothetical protein
LEAQVAQLPKQMEDAKKTIQETEELSRNIITQVSSWKMASDPKQHAVV